MAKAEQSGSIDDSVQQIGGTPRARTRPPHVAAPAHWQVDDGPPHPAATPFEPQEVNGRPDPVRYGDWEHKGLAIDF